MEPRLNVATLKFISVCPRQRAV